MPAARSLHRFARRLALLAVVFAAGPATAVEILTAKAGPSDEEGVYFVDAHVRMDVSPRALRSVVYRMCHYREHMPHVSYCRMFKAEGPRSWTYIVVDVPVVEPRDYTVVSEIEQDLDVDGRGEFRARWRLDERVGPGPRDGVVRLPLNEGGWHMVPLDGGRRTEVRYSFRCDPGGNIPSWAVGYATRRTLPDYMRTLERLARAEERRGAVIAPNLLPATMIMPLDSPLPPAGGGPVARLTALVP